MFKLIVVSRLRPEKNGDGTEAELVSHRQAVLLSVEKTWLEIRFHSYNVDNRGSIWGRKTKLHVEEF